MSDNPPVLTGKRKRAAVSYAELDDVFELPSDEEQVEPVIPTNSIDSDDDETFGTRRKVCFLLSLSHGASLLTLCTEDHEESTLKEEVQDHPKGKEGKPFRFFELPQELRDMIYEMALTDVNGVAIVAKTKGYRRTASRGPVYERSSYERPHGWGWGWGRRRRLKSGSESVVSTDTSFVPALLAVNKQINSEAINYLYGQDFVFEETVALQQFLAVIGPQNQQRLLSVEILRWSKRGASKAANYGAFTLLAGATNLQSLMLSCTLNDFASGMESIARQLFRDGHHFMEAYGTANGSKDAVVDIIELGEDNFDSTNFYRNSAPLNAEEGQEKFDAALRTLLGV